MCFFCQLVQLLAHLRSLILSLHEVLGLLELGLSPVGVVVGAVLDFVPLWSHCVSHNSIFITLLFQFFPIKTVFFVRYFFRSNKLFGIFNGFGSENTKLFSFCFWIFGKHTLNFANTNDFIFCVFENKNERLRTYLSETFKFANKTNKKLINFSFDHFSFHLFSLFSMLFVVCFFSLFCFHFICLFHFIFWLSFTVQKYWFPTECVNFIFCEFLCFFRLRILQKRL